MDPSDAEALRVHWNRRAVRRYLWGGQPVLWSMVQTVLAQVDADRARGLELFVRPDLERPQVIRAVGGLRSVPGPTVDAPPDTTGPPELVVSVDPLWMGRGLGAEAAEMVLQDAVQRGIFEVGAVVEPANAAAIAGLRRLGFVQQGDRAVLGHTLPWWLSRRSTGASLQE